MYRLVLSLIYVIRSGRPISGPEIASLLSVLVDAANEGSLAEVRIIMCREIVF